MDRKYLMVMDVLVILTMVGVLIAGAGDMMENTASIIALSRNNITVTNTGTVDVMLHRDGITGMSLLGVNQSIPIEGEENVKAEEA